MAECGVEIYHANILIAHKYRGLYGARQTVLVSAAGSLVRLGDSGLSLPSSAVQSMEPLIHDGDLCIMRQVRGGAYEYKTMLIQHRGVEAPETGGSYSIRVH